MNKTAVQFRSDHCSTITQPNKIHIICSNTNTFGLKIEKLFWTQNMFLLPHNASCRYRWKNGIYPLACMWMNYSLNRCLWKCLKKQHLQQRLHLVYLLLCTGLHHGERRKNEICFQVRPYLMVLLLYLFEKQDEGTKIVQLRQMKLGL